MKEIDKKIRDYYESKSLTKDQLDKIINSQEVTSKKRFRPLLKYVVIIGVALAAFLFYKYQTFFGEKKVIKEYAKEVAFNHQKKLKSDILSPDVRDLNSKMDKLNFEIKMPNYIDNKYQLLGGRYCSINERMAAQLKLKNTQTDLVVTLYVLDKLQSEDYDQTFEIDSTFIHLWSEKSSLFVLARDLQ